MKLMLVHASADYSTADVSRGIQQGLRAAGADLRFYNLNDRFGLTVRALEGLVPDGDEADIDDVALMACEALPYRVVATGCRWVLFVSGIGLHPNVLVALRRMGVKIAGWFTEAPYHTDHDKELGLARLVDAAFVNERSVVQTYQDVIDEHNPGGAAVYLPHAYDPERHRPAAADDPPIAEEDRSDVIFVGTGFAERQRVLEGVDWSGIDFKMGGLWVGVQAPSELHENIAYPCIDNSLTTRLYRGTKIGLNIHRHADGAQSANPRVFELAACGVFQISDRRDEIVELFGDAIPLYHPGVSWQLGSLVRRYLDDPEARAALAAEALRRVQGHTFEARASVILDTIARIDKERSSSPSLLRTSQGMLRREPNLRRSRPQLTGV